MAILPFRKKGDKGSPPGYKRGFSPNWLLKGKVKCQDDDVNGQLPLVECECGQGQDDKKTVTIEMTKEGAQMSLFKSLQGKKFDKRMVEWNLKNGVITQAEYDQYLNSLDDLQAEAESISLVDESATAETVSAPDATTPSQGFTNGESGSQGFGHH